VRRLALARVADHAQCRCRRPLVKSCFLSDFGLGNEWGGICHAVMSRISPQSPTVDLSHLIRPLEVAWARSFSPIRCRTSRKTPSSLAVVDPNVGKDREVAIETDSGRLLVGPDHGLLTRA
jgi:S-adenosyl-L-methionine hydrolase (adenosine-forming)